MKARIEFENIETKGLKYSPQTGIIYRSYPTTNGTRSKAGPIMGKNGRGYKCIHVERRLWRQHRLAFSFMGERLKDNELVDHINGNIIDNRWCNLKIVDHRVNCLNRKHHRDGGEPYIRKHSIWNYWEVKTPKIGKSSYLGIYKSLNSAKKARDIYLKNFTGVEK
jgi:hypothetical protein